MGRSVRFAAALWLGIAACVTVPGTGGRAQDSGDPQATISALQTQVAELSGAGSTPTPAPVEATGDQVTAPTATGPVNLEIILDVSGSMGQIVDTGETRLDAAKRILSEVAAAIPDEPGVNVGLRVYGHLGDNSETGRPVSCESSDLLIPVSGVDRAGLATAMAALVPTGWTPIGLSLDRSAADFPAEGPATNAVVLVTDGLETCGGDPAASAGKLATGDKKVVTHVIGFAVAPEEQQILQGITAASGGMLLGAGNATELTGALFRILDTLDVVKGAGFIGGSALSMLPAGEPGALSVVATGYYDGNTLPFVLRNNTGAPVISPEVVGVAKNAAGQMIATGGDQGITPNLIRPGGLSLGYVYFGGVQLPADTTFEITATAKAIDDEQFENQRDLSVVEAAYIDGRIVGTLTNDYPEELTGPFGVRVACFDANGALIDADQAYSKQDSAAPGAAIPFQVPGFGALDCPLFLVSGGGYSNSFDKRFQASDILTPEAKRGSAATVVTPVPVAPVATSTSAPVGSERPVPAATPLANGCFDTTTAEAIVQGLIAQGIPIGDRIAYTPETDPNEMMGRPGGYTSKTNFLDTRLSPKRQDFWVEDGGSVEVFSSVEDREQRERELRAAFEVNPLERPDVMFASGPVLIRVSARLLIPDSDAYGLALEQIMGCP